VADGGRTFTETEHFALLTDAVSRETASLAEAKEELVSSVSTLTAEKSAVEAEKSELESRIDVLEAEKVAAEKARDEAVSEFEAFKSDLAQKAAIAERKDARIASIKEAAADLLDDEYFTAPRVQRWAEMSDESFEQVVADFRDLAAKAPKRESKAEEKTSTETARESAAFKGGTSPTATETGSVLGRFLMASGKLPAAS
jgi:chromosome segregation ATPase